jgi:hypothetical protein
MTWLGPQAICWSSLLEQLVVRRDRGGVVGVRGGLGSCCFTPGEQQLCRLVHMAASLSCCQCGVGRKPPNNQHVSGRGRDLAHPSVCF